MKKTIVVDAMGGDNAPRVPVLATIKAMYQLPGMNFILVGDPAAIAPFMREIATGGSKSSRAMM